MLNLVSLQPVDYLLIGHATVDITPSGNQLGGTVAYAGLTARALGLRVGIVTSVGKDAPLSELDGIPIVIVPSEHSSTFENIKITGGRKQILHHRATPLTLEHIPQVWRNTPIIHLAPLTDEVDPSMAEHLSGSLLGATPQGWMRRWDETGRVFAKPWDAENSEQVLRHAGAVILSVEDVNRDMELVEDMAHRTRLLCLTEAEAGSVLYWNSDRRRFRPPQMQEVEATGAGDIYAAAFLTRLHHTRDPWEAARFATQLAAHSVTRIGLKSIPTLAEIDECLTEVLK